MKKSFVLSFFVILSGSLFAAKVDTVTIVSNCMNKEIKCVVITPKDYKKSGKRFSVVYLLHGYSGNYATWATEAPQLAQKSDELQLIFVCPDGGFSSWYFDSPVDSSVKYETFVTTELISFIDGRYKTKPNREHRAITGLSMGGHGALYLSIKHKDIFGAAGSICGGVDIRPFPDKWLIKKVLGDITTNQQNWENNTVINVADQLKKDELHLIIDCGIDDFFLQVNRNLHQKLMNLKIDHDYTERPGLHNKAYWSNAIDYQLLFFKKAFDKTDAVQIIK